MIVFACKECGNLLRQPDDAAGSLLFCSCGKANRVPWESTVDPNEAPRSDPASGSPSRRRADPNTCLLHEARPSANACADCGESFCSRCLVLLQGEFLCGPCKNHRVRQHQKTAPLSNLSVTSLVSGLVSAPVVFFTTLLPASGGAGDEGRLVAAIAGMVVPAAAVLLGILALRQTDGLRPQAGRGIAMTGAVCGIVGVLWSLSVVLQLSLHLLPG